MIIMNRIPILTSILNIFINLFFIFIALSLILYIAYIRDPLRHEETFMEFLN
jgi:hypothetical protein